MKTQTIPTVRRAVLRKRLTLTRFCELCDDAPYEFIERFSSRGNKLLRQHRLCAKCARKVGWFS